MKAGGQNISIRGASQWKQQSKCQVLREPALAKAQAVCYLSMPGGEQGKPCGQEPSQAWGAGLPGATH